MPILIIFRTDFDYKSNIYNYLSYPPKTNHILLKLTNSNQERSMLCKLTRFILIPNSDCNIIYHLVSLNNLLIIHIIFHLILFNFKILNLILFHLIRG